jgi:hypothetical protein
MWSVAVFEPALPGRNCAARASPVLSSHAVNGWNPNPPLNVAAAACLSEWAVIRAASNMIRRLGQVRPPLQ